MKLEGCTLLHVSALRGDCVALSTLSRLRVNFNATCDMVAENSRGLVTRYSNVTALHISVFRGDYDASVCIVKHGGAVDAQTKCHMTAYTLSHEMGHTELTAFLKPAKRYSIIL
eukprot:GHVR01191753.1.p1 GENE.GHVR01191753.1~~GHVR01191753.1.p1  ORF type:complete len:114 (+),score=19.88 GHVR01191753.1:383-724(+)